MTAPLKATKKKLWVNPPRNAMEVYELLPEGTRSEVTDNTLYMPPTPSFEHQEVSADLLTAIRGFVKENNTGKCVAAPISVYLNEKNVVEPDLVFILTEHLGIIQAGKIKGVPDLIVEILSPGNRNYDLEKKMKLYEAFGVPEYFIVDPLSKAVLHYTLKKEKYEQQASTVGMVHSAILQNSFSF